MKHSDFGRSWGVRGRSWSIVTEHHGHKRRRRLRAARGASKRRQICRAGLSSALRSRLGAQLSRRIDQTAAEGVLAPAAPPRTARPRPPFRRSLCRLSGPSQGRIPALVLWGCNPNCWKHVNVCILIKDLGVSMLGLKIKVNNCMVVCSAWPIHTICSFSRYCIMGIIHFERRHLFIK
jgi:hypothetical protein